MNYFARTQSTIPSIIVTKSGDDKTLCETLQVKYVTMIMVQCNLNDIIEVVALYHIFVGKIYHSMGTLDKGVWIYPVQGAHAVIQISEEVRIT